MPRLSDTQSILLAHAARNDTASLYPLPQTLRRGGGISRAVAALASAGYAVERETHDSGAVCRTEGDLCFGIYATAAGLAAIGITELTGQGGGEVAIPPEAVTPAAPPRVTRAAMVLALLSRPTGATLPELIAATGWLPHTTRAALTGLRKKGHVIVRGSCDGMTCYRIAAVVAPAASVAA